MLVFLKKAACDEAFELHERGAIAGCQLEGATVDEAIHRLKDTIDAMLDGGEL